MMREAQATEENGLRFFKNEEAYQKLMKAKELDAQNRQILKLDSATVNKKTVKLMMDKMAVDPLMHD